MKNKVKKILGYSIVGLLQVGFWAFAWAMTGLWYVPVLIFGGAVIILGLIFLAIWLIDG